ncbi:uncharacterized protein LOC134844172 [Symsagittifera roscoffensis]|uniref:uncharacterized protein LOC134844172 n=1 Tax=Symsagittifera roscoffensis TaxID=84072 RepID=UPI00307C6142
MERKLRHSYDNLTDYNSDKNGPQFNGLPPDSGRGSANTDLNLSSLQNNSFNLSTVSANFQPNSYNDFINSLNNTSVCSTNEPKHNNLSERTPVSSRRKVITSGTPRKVNGLKSTLPNRPFHPKDGFKITQNGHILNATMESVASTDLVSMNDSTLTHGRKKVIPKVLITNELTEEDRRRTSLAEAYPYVKSESSNNVVIAITKDEETRERKAISKALNDLQSLHEDFEVQSQSINGNVRSARSLNCSVDRLMPSASQDGLSASFIASSVSSNEKIFFDGLTKNELRTHKDISFRRKNYESMSSDDNYSVSTREMMDEVSDVVVMIRCRFKACGKIKELKEAKKYYKMCHNCFTYYCSRNCREAHWQRHKIKCVYSRVNSACKTVLNVLRNSRRNVETLSQFAEQQFYPEGRGVVFVKFSNLSDAEIFTRTQNDFPELEYITSGQLCNYSREYFGDILPEIREAIESYDPVSKMILAVGINILPYKESNKKVIPRAESNYITKFLRVRTITEDSVSTAKPKTVVATSAIKQETFDTERQRSLFFTNLQRNLKTKGVNLRVDFPFVYETVCSYVKSGNRFAPITIYPHNPETGQQFMCLIMPDSEPNFLAWVNETPKVPESTNSTELPSPTTDYV